MVSKSKAANKKEHRPDFSYTAKLLQKISLKFKPSKKAKIKGKVILPQSNFIDLTKYFAPISAKKKEKTGKNGLKSNLIGRVTA